MPRLRRTLNEKQLLILKVIYKFRFINVELMLKPDTGVSFQAMHKRLKVLLEHEYIFRMYSAKDRQMNRSASYCFAPKGIKALGGQPNINPSVLHAAYRDRTASEEFIEKSLQIFRLYRRFEKLYPGRFSILTKSETTGYDYYPNRLPDIHLQDKRGGEDFFLDIVEIGFKPIVLRQKLSGYSSHCDEGTWEEVTGKDYPRLLLVCATPGIERSLQRRVPRWLNNEEITAYTSSYKALLNSKSAKDEIWSDIDQPDELTKIL